MAFHPVHPQPSTQGSHHDGQMAHHPGHPPIGQPPIGQPPIGQPPIGQPDEHAHHHNGQMADHPGHPDKHAHHPWEHDDTDDYGECCPEGSKFMQLSAVDEVSRSMPVGSIGQSDYQNAFDTETFFLSQMMSSGGFDQQQITFEVDNGWFDVDGSDPSATYRPMASPASPYASMSPAGTGANGRTTGVVGSFAGIHNPSASAEGTVRFMDVGSDFKVDFSLSQIGNYGGPDEPGLARQNSAGNIDRGINITPGVDTVSGDSYDQFLEIIPSESAEGSLEVRFSGTDFSGNPWENPVYGFGFYLMGREDKRDVYLDVYDVDDNLITSELTHGAGVSASDATVEYIAFHVCEQEEDVGRFVLREEFDGTTDRSGDRDIFSIDDLTLFTRTETSSHPFDGIIDSVRFSDDLMRHQGSGERDKLNGTEGRDAFLFEDQKRFGKRHADKIIDFNGDQGDVIELSSDLFDGRMDLEIARVSNRRELKAMGRTDVDLVIWDQKHKPISMLMINNNGEDRGFGAGKGLLAILDRPDGFSADCLDVV